MIHTSRPPFPRVIDSSLIADFRACPERARLCYFEHWKPKALSVHLHAGAAFARGLEIARRSYFEWERSPEDSVALGARALIESYGRFECPEDSAKSLARTVGALEFYFDTYPLESDPARAYRLPDGKFAIEFNGVDPIEVDHPETGEPILFSWRMDLISEMSGLRLGQDEKTTSQLGASWPRKWDLRSQFTGYVWGAGEHGVKLDGFLVRGISILKTKYETAEAITYRPAWQVARWYKQLCRDVERMKQMWEEGYFDLALDNACLEYGGCQFRGVCLMQDPSMLLEHQFQRRRWDPVLRTEEEIRPEDER